MGMALEEMIVEHGTIRELLQQVIALAADAETGDYPERVKLARAVEQLKRALHQHALAEGGGPLDEVHDAEDAATIQLRCAMGLEDILRHVGEIAGQLAREEQIVQAGRASA